jgi:alpha-mannosidase/mannosylglycerate hydrolase
VDLIVRRVHYVFSSHWDREWYQPFQDYRYRLVQLIDRVLEGWRTGRLRGPFQTDGQAILLEDYLEIRPDAEAEVKERVREGRFVLGPFYIQPDEFLVSGESLIRNLRLGLALAQRLGGQPSRAGLLCDNFGHNSQMPQIFAEFGIRMGFVWRGTNLVHERLFRWRGADGTEMPCYRFGAEGYCSYAKFVRQQRLDQPRFSQETLSDRLEGFLDEEGAKTPLGPLLAFDGGDHMEWDPAAYAVLLPRLEQADGNYQIVHSSLDAYLAEVIPLADRFEASLAGELREPARHPEEVDKVGVALGTGSSRVWIKQANAACEALLCRWAEPLASFAHAALGLPYPHGFLETAWKWLLQNHPHDSICGCSIDAVHADMAYRFHQAEQIANRLVVEAARGLAAGVRGEVGEEELRCVVFNPQPRSTGQVELLDLEIPAAWMPDTTQDSRPRATAFRILDERGNDLPYQRVGQTDPQPRLRVLDTAFPQRYQVSVVQVALPLDLPPLGYRTLTIRKAYPAFRALPPETSAPAASTGLRSMTNEFLSVSIEPNGTLTLTDRRNGNVYRELLTFEDAADIGDGWNYLPPANNQTYLSTGSQAEIVKLHPGPFYAAFLVRVRLSLPEEFDLLAQVRSKQAVQLVIESQVALRAGASQVEIETRVNHNVRDHRLRALFPTHTHAEVYLSDTPFDAVERSIPLPADNHLYRQPQVETRPQQSWTAVFDPPGSSSRGLAVLSTGLYESAVQDTPERSIALTLLRATRRTVYTAGEPGGQVQGELAFKLALISLDGRPDLPELFDRAAGLAAGLRTAQLSRLDLELIQTQPGRPAPELPQAGSFLSVYGPLVLTSLRYTSLDLEARLFNPESGPVQGEIGLPGGTRTGPRPARAAWVDFESRLVEPPFEVQGEAVIINLASKQIKTLCFLNS